jgi:hypothetical protein
MHVCARYATIARWSEPLRYSWSSSRSRPALDASAVAPRAGTAADVADVVAALHAAGRKRETIRKSVTALAQVLDFAGVKDNPARDRVHVRLPREEREEPSTHRCSD